MVAPPTCAADGKPTPLCGCAKFDGTGQTVEPTADPVNPGTPTLVLNSGPGQGSLVTVFDPRPLWANSVVCCIKLVGQRFKHLNTNITNPMSASNSLRRDVH